MNPSTTKVRLSGMELDMLAEGLESAVRCMGLDFHSCVGARPDDALVLAKRLRNWRSDADDTKSPQEFALRMPDLVLCRAALWQPHGPTGPFEPQVLGEKYPGLVAALAWTLGAAEQRLKVGS